MTDKKQAEYELKFVSWTYAALRLGGCTNVIILYYNIVYLFPS
jgi:hypothetical protein